MSNLTTDLQLDELIAEHARCWREVGFSEAGSFDPGLKYKREEAREATEALKAACAKRSALPDSIQEALNSGDGVYRP